MWAALSRTRGLLHATASGGPRFDSRARHLSDRLGGRSEPLPSSHDLEVNAARLEPPRLQPGSTLPESTLPESTLPAEACRTSRLGAPQRGLDHSPSPMDPDPRGLTPPRPTAALGGPRARASPWPSDGVRRFVCSAAGRREEDKDGGGEELWGAALRAAVEAGPRAAARGDGEGLGAEEAATELARCYAALGPAGRRALLRALARDPHGVDHEAAATLAARVARMQGEGTRDPATLLQAEERLRQALAPRYKHLLVRLSRLEGGVKLLVDMRADALAAVAARDAADGPHLKELTMVLKALLSEWFSIGLLHLERVTWQSPCDMLQKIAQYEAVHPVRHWTDMRRRVGPYRRCFVFTHAAMPREPLVVLHVALTDAISSDIRSIVRESPTAATPGPAAPAGIVAPPEDAGRVRAAVFYSISATQRGLQGIDLGHHLIKHVVRQLQPFSDPGIHALARGRAGLVRPATPDLGRPPPALALLQPRRGRHRRRPPALPAARRGGRTRGPHWPPGRLGVARGALALAQLPRRLGRRRRRRRRRRGNDGRSRRGRPGLVAPRRSPRGDARAAHATLRALPGGRAPPRPGARPGGALPPAQRRRGLAPQLDGGRVAAGPPLLGGPHGQLPLLAGADGAQRRRLRAARARPGVRRRGGAGGGGSGARRRQQAVTTPASCDDDAGKL
ncbi:malonyl-CoA decarboxylase, mitochondrial isoform X1 [Lampetra fluviatilis]